MFEEFNTIPPSPPCEYNCCMCGKPLFAPGLCHQCKADELFRDEVRELYGLDSREPYPDEPADRDKIEREEHFCEIEREIANWER